MDDPRVPRQVSWHLILQDEGGSLRCWSVSWFSHSSSQPSPPFSMGPSHHSSHPGCACRLCILPARCWESFRPNLGSGTRPGGEAGRGRRGRRGAWEGGSSRRLIASDETKQPGSPRKRTQRVSRRHCDLAASRMQVQAVIGGSPARLCMGTALTLALCSDLGRFQPCPQPTTAALLPRRRRRGGRRWRCRWGGRGMGRGKG